MAILPRAEIVEMLIARHPRIRARALQWRIVVDLALDAEMREVEDAPLLYKVVPKQRCGTAVEGAGIGDKGLVALRQYLLGLANVVLRDELDDLVAAALGVLDLPSDGQRDRRCGGTEEAEECEGYGCSRR